MAGEIYDRRNGLSKQILTTGHFRVYRQGVDADCPKGHISERIGGFKIFRKPSVRLIDLLVSVFSPDFFEGCSAKIATDLRDAVLLDSQLSLRVMRRMQQYHSLDVMLEEFSKRYDGMYDGEVSGLMKKRNMLRRETGLTDDGVVYDEAKAIGYVCDHVCPVPDGFDDGGLRY
jgi:hypothetical protein